MKTRDARASELQELIHSPQGREQVVALWKKYAHQDPGHWQPAQGWDYAALVRDILNHEYAGLTRAQ